MFGGFLAVTAGGGAASSLPFVAGTYVGAAGIGGLTAKAGIGGVISLGYNEISTRAVTGQAPTVGSRVSSFTFGALFAPGVANINLGSPIVTGMANGSASAFSANVAKQVIDMATGHQPTGFSSEDLIFSTSTGLIAGGAGGSVMPYYSRTPSIGNSQSFGAGLMYGARVQIHNAPSTILSMTAQAHMDPWASVLVPASGAGQ